MNAKSKADFINSIAAGRKISCPNCNALNESDSLYCFSCGTKLASRENTGKDEPVGDARQQGGVAFKTVVSILPKDKKKPDISTPAFHETDSEPVERLEEKSVFAEGLPEWDMVPPQVMVRRKRK